jgi:hypothetical protein
MAFRVVRSFTQTNAADDSKVSVLIKSCRGGKRLRQALVDGKTLALPGGEQVRRPSPDDTRHLDENVFLAFPGSFERPETVVGSVQKVQGGPLAEAFAGSFQKRQRSQFVASAAEEEHRHGDVGEMLGPLRVWLAGLM